MRTLVVTRFDDTVTPSVVVVALTSLVVVVALTPSVVVVALVVVGGRYWALTLLNIRYYFIKT